MVGYMLASLLGGFFVFLLLGLLGARSEITELKEEIERMKRGG